MTSNIGSTLIQKSSTVGFARVEDDKVETANKIKKELTKTMAPELINRIDNVIIFNKLEKKQLYSICSLELVLAKKLLKKQLKIKLTYDSNVSNCIVDSCYEEAYGARPIKRYLRGAVMNAISDVYLENPKVSSIRITVKNDKLHYAPVN